MQNGIRVFLSAIFAVATAQASVIAYDNSGTPVTGVYGEANTNNPVFGDAVQLTTAGLLTRMNFEIFNSATGGNTGSIQTGNMLLRFYDNTVPYTSGSLSGTHTLLGSATVFVDLSGVGGIVAGLYTLITADMTSYGIGLTQNIIVTQQFTELTGTSTRNGIVLASDPTVGSSPASVYVSSSGTPEGLYAFSGGNPNQIAYQIVVDPAPEPVAGALSALGLAALAALRRPAGVRS
jgi:hypothetical protein